MEKSASAGTGRVSYLDIAKGIGIILVVIGHIEYVPAPIRFYIVTFHMPLFFIVSGMLMDLKGETGRSLKELFIKKLKRIMLPYLIFSVLYPLIDIVYFYVTGNGDPFGTLKTNISDTLMLYGYSVLWFLPTAFFSEIIFLCVSRIVGRILQRRDSRDADRPEKAYPGGYSVQISVSVMCLVLGLGMFYLFGKEQNHFILSAVRFFISSFLVSTGSLLNHILSKGRMKTPVRLLTAVILFGLLLMFHGRNGIVDMHFGVYGNIFLFLIFALTGSLGVILLSMSLEKLSSGLPCRVLMFYGRNSLFVMITHINFYVLYFSEVLSFKLVEYVKHAKELTFNVLTVFFVLLAEFIMIKIYGKARAAADHMRLEKNEVHRRG